MKVRKFKKETIKKNPRSKIKTVSEVIQEHPTYAQFIRNTVKAIGGKENISDEN